VVALHVVWIVCNHRCPNWSLDRAPVQDCAAAAAAAATATAHMNKSTVTFTVRRETEGVRDRGSARLATWIVSLRQPLAPILLEKRSS
jgi:hypothetical protein